MEAKINTQGRVNFMNLDLLRFVAAYMIVVLHFLSGWRANWGEGTFLRSTSANFFEKLANTGINNMFFGVDIFFLISGFLITYLLLAERDKTGTVDVWKFYIRRALRIWPLYFLILMICPIYNYFFTGRTPDFAYMFSFLGNFEMMKGGTFSPATDHLWSICVEEHFYLFCPLLLGFLPIKRIVPALLGVIVFTILFRYYIYFDEDFGINLYLNTFCRIDTLAIGSLFGYMAYNGQLKFNHPLPVRLMVYGILIAMFFTEPLQDYHSAFEAAFKKYLFILPTAYWMGNFLFHKEAILQPQKINIFHRLGKVSYGMYMFNSVIMSAMICLAYDIKVHSMPLFFIAFQILLFAIVFLSYRFFELPFLNMKESFSIIPSGTAVSKTGKLINPQPAGVATQEVPAVTQVQVQPAILPEQNEQNFNN